jgi:hypothetical protein
MSSLAGLSALEALAEAPGVVMDMYYLAHPPKKDEEDRRQW